jgi:hypothetical protein
MTPIRNTLVCKTFKACLVGACFVGYIGKAHAALVTSSVYIFLIVQMFASKSHSPILIM